MFKRIGKQLAQGAKEEITAGMDGEDLAVLAGIGVIALGLIFFRKPATPAVTVIVIK